MPTTILNPESEILQQTEGHWQKLLALIVWKLAKQGVMITADDIMAFGKEGLVLLTHGLPDGIEFKMVTQTEASQLIVMDKGGKHGSA